MTVSIRMKRGDTFVVDFLATDDEGTAVDLTGYTARAQIRFADKEPIDLTVTIDPDQTANTGLVSLEYGGATTSWPVATGLIDIEFTDGAGRIESSETIELAVGRDVTR